MPAGMVSVTPAVFAAVTSASFASETLPLPTLTTPSITQFRPLVSAKFSLTSPESVHVVPAQLTNGGSVGGGGGGVLEPSPALPPHAAIREAAPISASARGLVFMKLSCLLLMI